MATYVELYTLADQNILIEKITVAITIKADAILNDGAATPSQIAWAKGAFEDPRKQAKTFLYALLAAENAQTTTNIQNASDSAIQTRVNAAVDNIFGV